MPRLGSDETAKTPLPGRKAAEERGQLRLEMYPRLGGRGWGRADVFFSTEIGGCSYLGHSGERGVFKQKFEMPFV